MESTRVLESKETERRRLLATAWHHERMAEAFRAVGREADARKAWDAACKCRKAVK